MELISANLWLILVGQIPASSRTIIDSEVSRNKSTLLCILPANLSFGNAKGTSLGK